MRGLTGLGVAIRLLLRRDRLVLPIWIVALIGHPESSVIIARQQPVPTPHAR